VSAEGDAADVLAQVIPVGPNPHEADLAAAVSRHVSNRPAPAGARRTDETAVAPSDRLTVVVDFNDLLKQVGGTDVWVVLAKLAVMFP
jgi:hypothetical protein